MAEIHAGVTPLAPQQRILSLDVLRGVAVLGILIMNVQSFSMPETAYINPASFGDLTGLNFWVYSMSHLLADLKFMAIFSLMFGAGVMLLNGRVEARGGRPAKIHYRRMLWLLVFGLAHAYLLWYGDILVAYALCGMFVFLLRRMPPVWLVILGLGFIAVTSILYMLFGLSMSFWPPEAIQQTLQSWAPPAEQILHDIEVYQGNWWQQMALRIPQSIKMQTFVFFIYVFWRVTGLMLIGMALFHWRVLTAERSTRFYAWMILAGYGFGLPVILYGLQQHFARDWSVHYSMFMGVQFNYWGSLLVAAGHIGTVMLFCRVSGGAWFKKPLAAVGRMAFSNYILQSVICTFIFYGHGLGLYGDLSRFGQILVVPAVWLVLMVFSVLWLRRFPYGPLEWLWRRLTYGRLEPVAGISPSPAGNG
ncbi:MAG: DUF418 domain-containing protein [Acidobacteria bacterium]|nr:DUF418 domain-containing protein [Acidobacteriota bacterium]